jgi:hypothetical protein
MIDDKEYYFLNRYTEVAYYSILLNKYRILRRTLLSDNYNCTDCGNVNRIADKERFDIYFRNGNLFNNDNRIRRNVDRIKANILLRD